MKRLDPNRSRIWPLVCSLAALMLLTGCWTMPFPAGDLQKPFRHASLQPLLGLKKDEVREQLGHPTFVLVDQDKSYFLYSGYGDQISVLFVGYIPMAWTKEEGGRSLYCTMLEFDSDDVLTRFETKSDAQWGYERAATDCRKLFQPSDEPWLFYDPDLWVEWCIAAHEGDGQARSTIASHYWRGWAPVQQDPIQAYKWFSLAMDAGYTDMVTNWELMTETMTAEQIAEAERLANEWASDPAACEDVGTATISMS